MDFLRKLIRLVWNKEFISYVVFGFLTMLVSIGTFYLFGTVLQLHYTIANVISWIFAVSFAYITNKLFVFETKQVRGVGLLKEVTLFVAARLFSLGLELVGLYLLIDLLGWKEPLPQNMAKVIMQVVVVLTNYIFGKFLIFRKKSPEPAPRADVSSQEEGDNIHG